MTTFHRRSAIHLVALALAAAIPRVLMAQETRHASPSAVRVRIVHEGRPVEATGVLIRREAPRGREVVLHFVTVAHIFARETGEVHPRFESLTVDVDGRTLPVRPEDVTLSSATLFDVAVFSVSASDPIEPPLMTLTVPDMGEPFVVAGLTDAGALERSPQHVGRKAALSLGGDRLVMGLHECAGAPAIGGGGAFGIVTGCAPSQAPIIVPFAAIADWVARHVPGGLTLASSSPPPFRLTERSLQAPLLTAACGEDRSGDVDVPFQLSTSEAVVDAHVNILNRSSLRLAEVSVLPVGDRSVKLRFTLAGQEPARVRPSEPCPRGQALVSVRLDVLSQHLR